LIIQAAEWQPVLVADGANPAYSSATGGYARYLPTTAKLLTAAPTAGTTLPGIARHAIITVRSNPIRWRADGTAPTADEGQFMAAGESIAIDNSANWLRTFQFIDTAAGASEVTVTYFY
jgi:hypothetical protein